jgi:hypothetical protein
VRRSTSDTAISSTLPAELEQRIAALESQGQCGDDFDVVSFVWLFVLGIVMPLTLLLIGWWV